ncbi:MAG: rRNA cytosine-C5-methyltransferase [Bacteroides sp.]|nr:rRNA cytosine-C5-methyltransferase [Bacteroides sp.]MCM1413529.1 rRNA cytosine-C5-methyltransferase [Bacteroides sp.]MCM1471083.1 rRNA cytosine-C5-methyltransferase [Bacteroides sp.]
MSRLPEGFLTMLASLPGEPFVRLAEALTGESSVSVRVNPARPVAIEDADGRVPWCENGYYLAERRAFTFDPRWHQGCYYVQDASSMFIDYVVRRLTDDCRPVRYLDACAAPGGKTTAAIGALPDGSLVVANEFVGQRAAVLRENVAKWGNPACTVLQGPTDRFARDGARFDIIAADVPCSGEGMMRKDDEAVAQWSESLVEQCVSRQKEIVDNLWQALVPGGYMIYSTCTFNRRENEDMVLWLMEHYGAEPVAIDYDPEWGIIPAVDPRVKACRFLPGSIRGEGLFIAVVRKPDGHDENRPTRKQKKHERRMQGKTMAVPKEVAGWLNCDTRLSCDAEGNITARPHTAFDDHPYAPAVTVATMKGREPVPTQELAMSTLLRRGTFDEVELTRDQAIEYLRCQALTLPETMPRGIVLLTYGGYPLGWAKNIGNRANNLYPKQWRILSSH